MRRSGKLTWVRVAAASTIILAVRSQKDFFEMPRPVKSPLLGGQARQDLFIDLVLSEGLLVSPEIEGGRHSVLHREGEVRPRMMSVGLHCRLAGHPGRTAALERFLDYALSRDGVWFARRIDIARHWMATHPLPDSG
jgi:hypothetical protein